MWAPPKPPMWPPPKPPPPPPCPPPPPPPPRASAPVAARLPASSVAAKIIITRPLITFSNGIGGSFRHRAWFDAGMCQKCKREHRDELEVRTAGASFY